MEREEKQVKGLRTRGGGLVEGVGTEGKDWRILSTFSSKKVTKSSGVREEGGGGGGGLRREEKMLKSLRGSDADASSFPL